jgi:magnesium transporter
MHHYEEILNNIPVLALYLPMITSTGGNTGSQAASVIIRALSLEEIEWKNIFTVLLKEFKISLMIACTLFFFVVAKIISFSYLDDPHCNICVLSCAIGLALSTQVVVSIFIGTTLPMIVKFFKMDPSVIASPAITTLVDVTGVIIYFSLVRYFIPFL